MVKFALLVILEAKPGKEEAVENFLRSGLAIVEEEPDTMTWYALKLSATKFGIFDTFSHEEGRKAHLAGRVAEALMKHAPDLLAKEPTIEFVDVLAAKTLSEQAA